MARRASTDELSGVRVYSAALHLRAAVADRVQIVEGSVTAHVAGIGVVACPCLESLQNFNIGAQGAVRRAAGPSFEAGLDALDLPLEPLSTTLVEGGALAPGLVRQTPRWLQYSLLDTCQPGAGPSLKYGP